MAFDAKLTARIRAHLNTYAGLAERKMFGGTAIAVLAVIQSVQTDSLQRERVAGALGARIDAQLAAFEREGFAGTVLVVRDRHIILLKGYGLADPFRRVRNSAATRFEMNSMTKMFTGVAILQLAATGRLKVDDPVGRHLGAFPVEKRTATIDQQIEAKKGGVRPSVGASRTAK